MKAGAGARAGAGAGARCGPSTGRTREVLVRSEASHTLQVLIHPNPNPNPNLQVAGGLEM